MLPFIGGKAKIAESLIIPNIPKDIEVFLEGFSGMMWTFFKMDITQYPNLKKIVYNDFNPLNANLFRCVRNHKRLLDACNKLPVQQKGTIPTPPPIKLLEQTLSEFRKVPKDSETNPILPYNFTIDSNIDPFVVVEVTSDNGYGLIYRDKKNYEIRGNKDLTDPTRYIDPIGPFKPIYQILN